MTVTRESLRPEGPRRVIDLVREAGLDVSDWANFAGGPEKAAVNPRYCYEWSFHETGRIVVLNVWFDAIVESNGTLTLSENFRSSANRHSRESSGRAPVWARRALRCDVAVAAAAREGLPIRAVICDGDRRRLSEDRASKVKARKLDPVPWTVTSYDAATGAFTLTRGALPRDVVDQFDIPVVGDTPTERRQTAREEFFRDSGVRRAALARAGGFCGWCGVRGFVTGDGRVFLETHHVVPLSEGGQDHISNVVAVCPNHHREAHFGARAVQMRLRLREIAAGATGGKLPS